MPVAKESIAQTVIEYLKHKASGPIGSETDLFAAGVLDSMEVMEVIHFLETKFGVEIDPEEIAEENFRTAQAMAALVEGKIR